MNDRIQNDAFVYDASGCLTNLSFYDTINSSEGVAGSYECVKSTYWS